VSFSVLLSRFAPPILSHYIPFSHRPPHLSVGEGASCRAVAEDVPERLRLVPGTVDAGGHMGCYSPPMYPSIE
jgi:hypothetical protein